MGVFARTDHGFFDFLSHNTFVGKDTPPRIFFVPHQDPHISLLDLSKEVLDE